MAERSNTIDYAQAVLSKYPDACPYEDFVGNWRLWGGKAVGWLSEQRFADRDAAWRDAYERMNKGTKVSCDTKG